MDLKVPVDEAEEMLFVKPHDKQYPLKGNYFSTKSFREKSPVDAKKYRKYLEKPSKTDDRHHYGASKIPRSITETSSKKALPEIASESPLQF